MTILTNISTGIQTVILLVFRERTKDQKVQSTADKMVHFQTNQLMNLTGVKTKVYKAEGEKNKHTFFQLSASPIRPEVKILFLSLLNTRLQITDTILGP